MTEGDETSRPKVIPDPTPDPIPDPCARVWKMGAALSALTAVLRPDGGGTSAWDVFVTVWDNSTSCWMVCSPPPPHPLNCAPVMEQVAFVKSEDGPRPRRNRGNKKAPCLSDDQMKRGAENLPLI